MKAVWIQNVKLYDPVSGLDGVPGEILLQEGRILSAGKTIALQDTGGLELEIVDGKMCIRDRLRLSGGSAADPGALPRSLQPCFTDGLPYGGGGPAGPAGGRCKDGPSKGKDRHFLYHALPGKGYGFPCACELCIL